MGLLIKYLIRNSPKKVVSIKKLIGRIIKFLTRKFITKKTVSPYEGGTKKDIDKLTDPDWDC